jgi:hypothetical protein
MSKTQVQKEFIVKLADAAKTNNMSISTLSLNFDPSGKNAFYSMVDFKGTIIISTTSTSSRTSYLIQV